MNQAMNDKNTAEDNDLDRFRYISSRLCFCLGQFAKCSAQKSHPEHLLWALLHMKLYCPEPTNAALVGASEKTFRKWCHIFVRLIAKKCRW